MSVVFFKNFGASNEFIGVVTNLLTLPWTIKPLWSAFVDVLKTKRWWILQCQLVLALLLFLLSISTLSSQAIIAATGIFALIAFTSATQDIAIDGYYLDVLDKQAQALYVGVRNTAYKLAWLFGSGALVYLSGRLGKTWGLAGGWSAAFALCAAILGAATLFHRCYLPEATAPDEQSTRQTMTGKLFAQAFSTYFKQAKIKAIVLYILTFRLGDALMLSMAQPFLLDSTNKGGLGISTEQVGLIYGTAGMIALLAGGIVGGWLVSRDGLKKWLWPSAVMQNSAILLYWFLAAYRPPVTWVAAVNALEQFSYGIGVSAYTVFLLSTVKPDFKAAHYAIATGMMALGLLVPGAISGYLTHWLGYERFFFVSFLAAIPGIITIFFLPVQNSSPSGDSAGERESE